MAQTNEPNQRSAPAVSWAVADPLSKAERAELFPRSVRPAVIAMLWAVLVVLVTALMVLSLQYSRNVG